MLKRFGVCIVALALTGAVACGDKNTNRREGGAGRFTVQVDAKKAGQDFNLFASAFFPKELKIHAGDTVDFKVQWSGEPHTVTFGTLVDQGAAKLDPKTDDEPAEWQKIPPLLPDGPGDASQVTANPCFIATGDPPKDACPATARTQPEFTGAYPLYNSGFIPEDGVFSVKFAKTVPATTYNYFCSLHRGVMTGKVIVVPASEKIPAGAQSVALGDAEIATLITTLTPLATALKTSPGAGVVKAGGLDPANFEKGLDAGVTQFAPKDIRVATGGTVKWAVGGAHTVTFNAPQDLVEYMKKAPDGTWHLNAKSFAPAGGPTPVPPPGDKPVSADGGSWNGEGLLNSGILLGFGPLEWKLKFTKAGTYKYQCMVHPDMEGSVTVG